VDLLERSLGRCEIVSFTTRAVQIRGELVALARELADGGAEARALRGGAAELLGQTLDLLLSLRAEARLLVRLLRDVLEQARARLG